MTVSFFRPPVVMFCEIVPTASSAILCLTQAQNQSTSVNETLSLRVYDKSRLDERVVI